jgi:hypothetical protein
MSSKWKRLLAVTGLCAISALCFAGASDAAKKHPAEQLWQSKLTAELPLLGHRNWIAVVDSAYPWQTSAGVDTIETYADQLDVVREVLDRVAKAGHVRAVVFTDAELRAVPETDAPGVEAYRAALGNLLAKTPPQSLPHEQIIAKLADAGSSFHVLVLKTKLMIPYTSVFIRLDCGYWTDEQEKRLREKMAAK